MELYKSSKLNMILKHNDDKNHCNSDRSVGNSNFMGARCEICGSEA